MNVFTNLFKLRKNATDNKKGDAPIDRSNFLSLLPEPILADFKASGLTLDEVVDREDFILLLNCLFFGSKKHVDKRPLAILQEYEQLIQKVEGDEQTEISTPSVHVDRAVTPERNSRSPSKSSAKRRSCSRSRDASKQSRSRSPSRETPKRNRSHSSSVEPNKRRSRSRSREPLERIDESCEATQQPTSPLSQQSPKKTKKREEPSSPQNRDCSPTIPVHRKRGMSMPDSERRCPSISKDESPLRRITEGKAQRSPNSSPKRLKAPAGDAEESRSVSPQKRRAKSKEKEKEIEDKDLFKPQLITRVRTRLDLRPGQLDEIFVKENPKDHFKVMMNIGHGAYGSVYCAKPVNKNEGFPELVGIKKMKVDGERKLQDIANEILSMEAAQHPNIIRHLRSYLWKDTVWLVMEYCDGITLKDLAQGVLREDQMAYVLHEVLVALNFLHSNNRMHRDVKGENVLICSDGSVKLADLGLSTSATDKSDKKTIAGSRYWIAPEMITSSGYGTKADIWSLGCLCFELTEGAPPYYQYHPIKALYYTAKKGAPPLKEPQDWSKELRDFVSKCLERNPANRPSAAELLKHPFLKKQCPKNEMVQALGRAVVVRETLDMLF